MQRWSLMIPAGRTLSIGTSRQVPTAESSPVGHPVGSLAESFGDFCSMTTRPITQTLTESGEGDLWMKRVE